MKFPLLFILTCFMTACASLEPSPAIDNFRAKNFAPPLQKSLIVLLPVSKTEGLATGESMMTEQLRLQLTMVGYKTATLGTRNYEEIWNQEINAVGGNL